VRAFLRRGGMLVLVALTTTGASWVDPHATARQAARLYGDGKFGESAAKYREALIDDPDSSLLHYNAGLASYRDGKYDDALAALGAVASTDADPARTARAAYAAGNTKYRQGSAAEAANPKLALTSYAEALAAYRRAMGADPADEDAKFNHELVEKKLADLKKKLEEQKQKQQDQQQKQDQQKQDQQKQDEKQQDQQQQGDQEQQQQQDQQQQQAQDQQQEQQQQPQDQGDQKQAGAEPKPEDGEKNEHADTKPEGGEGEEQQKEADRNQQPAAGDGVAGGEPTDEMSPREAEALLDGQRDQEVRPDEIVRQLEHGRVAEPREDW
jgi:Ca-activated chloride channel family protein